VERYIDEALGFFGDAEVVFASHHWPVWGNDRVRTFLEQQRDQYRYLHDQTLRLANGGATPDEIAEQLVLPASLRNAFPSRDYYGTVRHNAKAVYQNYFGWYDGNPAHLDPLPPADASTSRGDGRRRRGAAQGPRSRSARRVALGRDAVEPARVRRT
jgi:alkyl sulfatase BDS1-like metallo-beta-lactamase superfamily hydrolase